MAPEQTEEPSEITWLGESKVFAAVCRTINTSFWDGLQADLIAGERVKVIPVAPVFAVDAVTVPEP